MTRGRSYLILELSIWAISAVSLAARWVRRICLLLHFVVWIIEAMAAAAFMVVAIAVVVLAMLLKALFLLQLT